VRAATWWSDAEEHDAFCTKLPALHLLPQFDASVLRRAPRRHVCHASAHRCDACLYTTPPFQRKQQVAHASPPGRRQRLIRRGGRGAARRGEEPAKPQRVLSGKREEEPDMRAPTICAQRRARRRASASARLRCHAFACYKDVLLHFRRFPSIRMYCSVVMHDAPAMRSDANEVRTLLSPCRKMRRLRSSRCVRGAAQQEVIGVHRRLIIGAARRAEAARHEACVASCAASVIDHSSFRPPAEVVCRCAPQSERGGRQICEAGVRRAVIDADFAAFHAAAPPCWLMPCQMLLP